MANYHNFRSVIVLKKDPLVKGPTVTKVSAVPKSTSVETVKPVSLDIYTDNKTKGIQYSGLQCPSVFTQTLGEMCLILRQYISMNTSSYAEASSCQSNGERLVWNKKIKKKATSRVTNCLPSS